MIFYTLLLIVSSLIGLFFLTNLVSRVKKEDKMPHGLSEEESLAMKELTILPDDKILILAPHPDDAALTCSGLIKEALRKGAKVKVVYITYGSHSSDTIIKNPGLLMPMPLASIIKQGRVRHDEAVSAMTSLGLKEEDLIFLGFPDSRTLKLWTGYFNEKAFTSAVLATNKVIYKTAYKPGTRFNAKNEFNQLKEIISSFKPTKIIYSDTFDLNPDHRATGLFLNAVLSDLEKEGFKPLTYSYFVHSEDWPGDTSVFYPPFYFIGVLKGDWYCVKLSPEDMISKLNAIEKHKVPLKGKPSFLLSFVKKNEIFFKPHFYSLNESLPVWGPKELQKLGVLNYVSEIRVIEEEKYFVFDLSTKPRVSKFSKINIFIYPVGREPFLNMPKYKAVVSRKIHKFSSDVKDISSNIIFTEKESSYVEVGGKDRVVLHLNKELLADADYFFLGIELEKVDVRVGETPWWVISLNNRRHI